MTTNIHDEQVDPILRDVVHQKVQNMVGRSGITAFDVEDIMQHIFSKLLERVAIDARHSPRGKLLETIVDRLLANLRRDRTAQRRDPCKECSLSFFVGVDEDGRPITLAATIGENQHDMRLGVSTRSHEDVVDKELDLQSILSKLPGELADLCRRLKYATPAEAARDLNIPPTTVYDRIRQIRRRFENDELTDYS